MSNEVSTNSVVSAKETSLNSRNCIVTRHSSLDGQNLGVRFAFSITRFESILRMHLVQEAYRCDNRSRTLSLEDTDGC